MRAPDSLTRAAALLAHRGHVGLELATDDVGGIAHLGHAPADVLDVAVPDAALEHDDHSDLPRTSARGRSSDMSLPNLSGLRDCGPSDSASAGLLCTSMMSPSAPAASPALAIADTYSQWPVPCEGSTRIGR